jgi:hypothetical protein
MYNRSGRGRGLGRGSGGGMGFGFRGASPPWPYVGRGRGGLPRCGYFLSGAGAPGPSQPPFYAGTPATPGSASYTPGMAKEEELASLRNQAEVVKEQLQQMEARIRKMENKE